MEVGYPRFRKSFNCSRRATSRWENGPRHLEIKAGRFKTSSVRRNEVALRQILAFFGPEIRLSEITVAGLSDYILHRRRQPGTRIGSTVSEQTIHHEIHAVGNLFRRAVSEGVAKQNPVSLLNAELCHR